MKFAVVAVVLSALMALALASAFSAEDDTPLTPTRDGMSVSDLLDFLAPSDDVFEGCGPIGSAEPDVRTAVYSHEAADGHVLIFACYSKDG